MTSRAKVVEKKMIISIKSMGMSGFSPVLFSEYQHKNNPSQDYFTNDLSGNLVFFMYHQYRVGQKEYNTYDH